MLRSLAQNFNEGFPTILSQLKANASDSFKGLPDLIDRFETVQRRCEKAIFDSGDFISPILDIPGFYHINIQAGFFEVLCPGYSHQDFINNNAYDILRLIIRCAPQPKVLSVFWSYLNVLEELGDSSPYKRTSDQMKENYNKLLSWLESFPTEYIFEIEDIKNNLLPHVFPRPPSSD
ncbi:hypothetical protein L218DRAFT_947862 [Marasmius fiardii PR-910]|nr:hypothetical protein L218DRAFT_947862 [Marasmius fiardii PR-910]